MSTSGTERDKGRKCESGYAKRRAGQNVTRAENVNQVTQRDKSGTERDEGRKCESGYAKRQERDRT
jgi:hypothetical protein